MFLHIFVVPNAAINRPGTTLRNVVARLNTDSVIDVRHHIQWRRHLVNAYEVKAGMVFFAG